MSDVKLLIVKETTTLAWCTQCQGLGAKKRVFQGRTFSDPCRVCGGTGKQRIIHRTEITLEEALQIIKKNQQK